MIETHKRTLVRMITYRLTAWLLILPLTYWATGSFWSSLGYATALHLLLSFDHYLHERIWLNIRWGLIQKSIILRLTDEDLALMASRLLDQRHLDSLPLRFTLTLLSSSESFR